MRSNVAQMGGAGLRPTMALKVVVKMNLNDKCKVKMEGFLQFIFTQQHGGGRGDVQVSLCLYILNWRLRSRPVIKVWKYFKTILHSKFHSIIFSFYIPNLFFRAHRRTPPRQHLHGAKAFRISDQSRSPSVSWLLIGPTCFIDLLFVRIVAASRPMSAKAARNEKQN